MSVQSIDDGGPAFPLGDNSCFNPSPGMSLRDWFAGKALQGIVNRSMWDIEGDPLVVHRAAWAKYAYLVADAMLKARLKVGGA